MHTTTATRQSRKGEISSWKAYAPGFAGKAAIEAVDRAMRGETSPSPVYEGEDGFLAWLLNGPESDYTVRLPEPGEARRAILDTYTKEHSAEYQAQALIDLARRLREKTGPLDKVRSVVLHTSHHTHNVIGSGANDPQKYDPTASRETLDHSAPYILTVALEDGGCTTSAPTPPSAPAARGPWSCGGRSPRSRIRSGPAATTIRTRSAGRSAAGVVITLEDGSVVEDELAVADAHPAGARPFDRPAYARKFRTLAEGIVAPDAQDRFLSAAERVAELSTTGLDGLFPAVDTEAVAAYDATLPTGLFR